MNDTQEDENPIEISMYDKKRFIINQARHLNIKMKEEIVSIVKTILGESGPHFMTSNAKNETNINLNIIEEKNIELLNHIYNKVKSRINFLSTTN